MIVKFWKIIFKWNFPICDKIVLEKCDKIFVNSGSKNLIKS